MEKQTLNEADLEAIKSRLAGHSCQFDLTQEDAIFLKKLNHGTNATAWLLFKGFLALVSFGLIFFAGFGLFAKIVASGVH
jgi:hypothetical protein